MWLFHLALVSLFAVLVAGFEGPGVEHRAARRRTQSAPPHSLLARKTTSTVKKVTTSTTSSKVRFSPQCIAKES